MINVILHALANSSASQQAFADTAVRTLGNVLNDPAFLPLVRGGAYSSSRFQTDDDRFVEASNDDIVTLIQTGKEYQTLADGTIDISVSLGQLGGRVMGGSTPPAPLITTNTRFFDDWQATGDALSLAAHWFHEWLHVAGLRHLRRRPDFQDAVYQLGEMVVTVGRQLLPQPLHQVARKAAAHAVPAPGQSYLDAMQQEADEADMG